MLWRVKFWQSKSDFCRLFHTKRLWHTCWYAVVIVSWLVWFAFWCKNILFELFWNVKHFIAVHYKLISQVREGTMLKTRRPVYKQLFKLHVTWWWKRRCLWSLSTLSVLANRSLVHSRCHGMVVPKVCLQALPLSLFSQFFSLFPQTDVACSQATWGP